MTRTAGRFGSRHRTTLAERCQCSDDQQHRRPDGDERKHTGRDNGGPKPKAPGKPPGVPPQPPRDNEK